MKRFLFALSLVLALFSCSNFVEPDNQDDDTTTENMTEDTANQNRTMLSSHFHEAHEPAPKPDMSDESDKPIKR